MLKKSVLQLSIAAALVLASGTLLAATPVTTTIAVSAEVSKKCTITTGSNLAFTPYDPVSTVPVNATGTVNVICSKGTTGVVLGMGDGLYPAASGGQRRMKGPGAADFLSYNLFQPSGTPSVCTFPGSTPWNSTTPMGIADAPSSAARIFSVCGTIPTLQDATAGTYNDVIIATLTF